LIVDSPSDWNANTDAAVGKAIDGLSALNLTGAGARNAALYFPRIRKLDPSRPGQIGTFSACGAVAGVMARTDTQRGVWKAPAGLDASLVGTQDLPVKMNNLENGFLNPLGVNCLRSFREA